MTFAALGALVILTGAVKLLFFGGDHAAVPSCVYTAICSATPEAVAALLLTQADRANRQMADLFDRDRRDRDLAAAQQIAAELADRTVGDLLQAWLVVQLVDATDSTPSALASVLDEASAGSVEWIVGADGRARAQEMRQR
jgi:hypothetical protein